MGGDGGADVDHVLAAGLALEHLVERRRTEHLGRADADQLGNVLHGVVGETTVLLLREVAERDGRRLRDRVPADDFARELDVLRGETAQRSTSPRMGSTLEMMATP